jgi:hypothetical protein
MKDRITEDYNRFVENGALDTRKGRRFQKQAELYFPNNEYAQKYYFWQRAMNDYSEQQALTLTQIYVRS